VASGRTREFLSGVPVEALDSALSGFSAPSQGPGAGSGTARPELTDLLRRLGIKTLGDFAALPAADVLSRFGFDGALAHRLAGGYDHRPLAVRTPPPDLDVTQTYDEPLERVDVAAFAGRALAERLHERLAAHGLACTRLGIDAVTADGQELHRVWRHDGMLTAGAIAERVRWQLDGWLTGARRGAPAPPTAGLVRLRLIPDGVLVHLGLQAGLWGDAGAERERAHRALSRIQGLLGPDAVVTAVPRGGRSADDQVRLVPWGDERVPDRPAAQPPEPIPGHVTVPVLAEPAGPPATGLRLVAPPAGPPPTAPAGPRRVRPLAAVRPAPPVTAADDQRPGEKEPRRPPVLPPWPGRLPKPAAALVLTRPRAAVVVDAAGVPVRVSARLELTGEPARLLIGTEPPVEITGWAGPWPVDERWWAPAEARRRARFQIGLADGRAFLLSLSGGHWAVEAIYD
jgi:protein ImuB